MAVRTIKFTVAENGITPAVKQFGGVQGDHKSTKVLFEIGASLFSDITAQADELGGSAIYRIDGYDGEGGVARSETSPLMADEIPYYLEEWITRYGGTVRIVLVISLFKDDTTEMELYSFPALLSLKNLPDGKDTDGSNYESLSTLSQTARDAADTAVQAAADAEESKEQTELARAALEGDSVFIFDGNGTFGAVKPVFVVDDTLSASSNNAIANKPVAEKINELLSAVSTLQGKYTLLETKVNLMRSKTRIYMSDTDENPADIYGGTWERIKGSFLWGIDDGESAGVTGGEKTHTLTQNELPKITGSINNYALQEQGQSVSTSGVFSTRQATEWATYGSNGKTQDSDIVDLNIGNNQPHNNMPPYYGVYIWIRKD